MANFVYKKAKEALLNGDIDFLSNQFKIMLVDASAYTPNENSHEFVSDIPVNAIVKRSEALSSISTSSGILDAQDLLVSAFDGTAFDSIILYQYNSNDTQARLFFYIDTAQGLPFDGSNSIESVTIIWDNGSSKILSL